MSNIDRLPNFAQSERIACALGKMANTESKTPSAAELAKIDRLPNQSQVERIVTAVETLADIDSMNLDFETCTDEELVTIVGMLDSGKIRPEQLPWEVGDARYFTYPGGQEIKLVIVDTHPYNGVGHYAVGYGNVLKASEPLHDSTTFYKWSETIAKNRLETVYYENIPSSIKPIFKEFTVYTGTPNDQSGPLDEATAHLSLFSVKEVFGNVYRNNLDSSTTNRNTPANERNSNLIKQFDYFKDVNNKIKFADANNHIAEQISRIYEVEVKPIWALRTPDVAYGGRGLYVETQYFDIQNSISKGHPAWVIVRMGEYANWNPTKSNGIYVSWSPFGVI